MFNQKLTTLANNVLKHAREKSLMIVTAESCTGGLLSALLTEISGSSDVFDRGFATYSNEAKMDSLNVPATTLKDNGAVSAQTAIAMATGALRNSQSDISLVTTGIAGPGGATADKPVGLVHFAIALKNSDHVYDFKEVFAGNRSDVRYQACVYALEQLDNIICQAA